MPLFFVGFEVAMFGAFGVMSFHGAGNGIGTSGKMTVSDKVAQLFPHVRVVVDHSVSVLLR